MKKNLAKVFGGVMAVALLLTGCATLSNVQNTSKEMIYYGGSAVSVGGYTYFANGYTPYSSSTDFDYSGSAKTSYLARIKNDVATPDGKDFSPEKVEKVNSKVVGFQNQDMFVLGNYIYFTSTNTHQYGKPQRHDYSLVTLWRSKLNGDGLKELYTTEYFTNGKFAPVGDAEHGYYWICFTGDYTSSNEFSGQIFSIKLGSSVGKATKIADHVRSCAFANVNVDGELDRIFYTKSVESEIGSADKVFSIDYAGKNEIGYEGSNTISFVDKIKDRVLFTTSETLNSQFTCYRDVANIEANEAFENGLQTLVVNNEIEKFWLVSEGELDEGYVYLGSGRLMYVTDNSSPRSLVESSNEISILFVENDYVYYSSGNSIFRVSVTGANGEPQTIVTMTSLQSGQYGFDGENIYYFAGLEDVETEKGVEDSNMYMYRVRKGGGEYQLIGKTRNDRTPKQDEQ